MKGIRNGRSKITEDDVRFIRSEYFAIKQAGIKNRSVSELDEMFGLDRTTIINIAKRKTWRHIE